MPGLSGFRDNETGHARANVVTPPPTLINLVTIGSLATHQILAQLATRILRYGDGGARAHVQRCPTPPMTCGKHVQSPAVATQHLRPAGLGHVIPTTASARPVVPALPCGEQSQHHVTRTNEARPRDWWAERAFAPGTNPTLACALGRPRRPRSTLWAAGDGVAWLGAAIDSRCVSPPARFSLAVNAECHAIQ